MALVIGTPARRRRLLAGVYALMPTLDPTLAAMLPLPLQARAIGAYAVVGLLLRVTQLKKPNG
jgi:hypothetical protein